MKAFMTKRQTKTAPSWSFILMLLMTADKSSEFDRICVDQGSNLVFEGRAILHGMPSNFFMVFTYGIDIVSFWVRRSSRPCRTHNFGSVSRVTLRRTLEASDTPWLFSLYCPEDSLDQSLDHIFVWTSRVKENQPGKFGHMMTNEENLRRAHLVPYVTFFCFFFL